MEESYKQYLEEKFTNLNGKIDFNRTLLEKQIEADRLLLESNINNIDSNRCNDNAHFRELIQNGFDNLSNGMDHLSNQNEIRINAVENGFDSAEKKILGFEKKMEDAFFFMKHPKLFIGIIVVLVLLSIGSIVASNPFNILSKEKEKIESVKSVERPDMANLNYEESEDI